jgi:hypothetical protein
MINRFAVLSASLAALSAGLLAAPALSANKLKEKSGYWVECRYSGLDEVCEYVYGRPKAGAKFRRVKAQ